MKTCVCVLCLPLLLLSLSYSLIPPSQIRLISWCLVCSVKDYLKQFIPIMRAHQFVHQNLYIISTMESAQTHYGLTRARTYRGKLFTFYCESSVTSFTIMISLSCSHFSRLLYLYLHVRTQNTNSNYLKRKKKRSNTKRTNERKKDVSKLFGWMVFSLLFLENA